MDSQNSRTVQKVDQKPDIDTLITNILLKKGGLVSQPDLIEAIYLNTGRKNLTARRKIGKRAGKDLKRVHYKEFKKYGIKDNNKKNAWIVLGNIPEIRKHIDEVLDKLNSNSQVLKLSLYINELYNYIGQYSLSSKELDKLVFLVGKVTDKGAVESLSEIILYQLSTYDTRPSEKGDLLKIVKKMIKSYPSSEAINSKQILNIRRNLIRILGIFDDEEGMIQLKYDAKNEYLKNIEIAEIYCSKHMSELIERHRSDLLELEEKLLEDGKVDTLEAIKNIRKSAMSNLDPRIQELSKKLAGVAIM